MKTISLLLGLMLSASAFAQDMYIIKSQGSNYTQSQIINAFSTANFCGSHFESKRHVIKFDDGAIVELKSKQELEAEGIHLDDQCFLSDNTELAKAIWSISSNGYIMRGSDSDMHMKSHSK